LLSEARRCSVKGDVGPPAQAHIATGNIPIQLN